MSWLGWLTKPYLQVTMLDRLAFAVELLLFFCIAWIGLVSYVEIQKAIRKFRSKR